jgi:succinate-semialdehyde dehydrogenase/glutarate-semialdehyde dehydrogenase
MGKPIDFGKLEVLKCADAARYYAEHAQDLLKDEYFDTPGSRTYVRYEPLGPIFLIMPFNFPIWMPFKAGIAHLMAGNTMILKHAENTPRCAEMLDEVTTEAGMRDEFKVIFPTIDMSSDIIGNPLVAGVSMTGAIGPGKIIAAIAGSHMKKAVFELGGSDPFIVLKDADIPLAAKSAVAARLMNTGQVCIAAKRIIVEEPVRQEFTDCVIAEIQNWIYSDPSLEGCKLGPMAREDLANNIERQIAESVSMGANLISGGVRTGPNMITPAVLTGITYNMPVFKEETFGPVIPIIPARDENEAIDIANQSDFGLSSIIFTSDTNRAEMELAPRIEAGATFINDTSKAYIPVPFGGMKGSGLGRELGSAGIKEFTNQKVVSIKL